MDIEKTSINICNKLIKIRINKHKTVLEVFDNLLTKEEKEYRDDILINIPRILSLKGYEIVNKNYFELIKY